MVLWVSAKVGLNVLGEEEEAMGFVVANMVGYC